MFPSITVGATKLDMPNDLEYVGLTNVGIANEPDYALASHSPARQGDPR
jgi:hypothetical protein